MSDASVAHEFYKIRNKWKTIDKRQWQMAIWVCEYQDIDILDKFMEIEASPIGIFDDIFFRIQTTYTNDTQFEKEAWEAFLSWFNIPKEREEYDLIAAMKKDGYLSDDYAVNKDLPPTFDSMVTELLRLKALLKYDTENFILYFPPGLHEKEFQKWISKKLEHLPKGIRFASIDPREGRMLSKLSKHKTATVVELSVALDMAAAMKNEMNKDSEENKPHKPSAKFQKQVRKVMDATIDDEISVKEETDTLIHLGYQLEMLTTKATAHLVSSIAFFSQKEDEEALEQVEKTIALTDGEDDDEGQHYALWRSAVLLKAALVLAKKKKDIALSCYQEIGTRAVTRGDVFYAMEAYRMKAFIYFQSKKLKDAWEAVIYALQAGSNLPLEVRRTSTFLYSAAMAMQIAKYNDKKDVQQGLEERFKTLIGDDWDTLLKGTETIDMKYMNRKKWLTANKFLEWV